MVFRLFHLTQLVFLQDQRNSIAILVPYDPIACFLFAKFNFHFFRVHINHNHPGSGTGILVSDPQYNCAMHSLFASTSIKTWRGGLWAHRKWSLQELNSYFIFSYYGLYGGTKGHLWCFRGDSIYMVKSRWSKDPTQHGTTVVSVNIHSNEIGVLEVLTCSCEMF